MQQPVTPGSLITASHPARRLAYGDRGGAGKRRAHALSPVVEAELRQQARLRAAHYSTRIEGNRLTLEQAVQAIQERRTTFQGRERDVREVRNY